MVKARGTPARSVGQCIYCLTKTGPLSEEHVLGSRDKVGGRNEIREVIRGEPLANQGIHSAAADYNLPFHARPQRTECNVVSDLGSLRNFVPRP